MNTCAALAPGGGSNEFLRQGVLWLPDLIARDKVDSLRGAFFDHCKAYLQDSPHPDALQVGHRRFMMTPEFELPFADPDVYAPGETLALMRSLLSEDCILGSFGAVLSLPGAATQHIHRDFGILFPGSMLDHMLPAYAITLVVPLIDVDEITGTTVVWPGSHRQLRRQTGEYALENAVWPRMAAGDGLLMDYRLIHAGSANRSAAPRPILYMVYYRPWFRDHMNYQKQERLRITPRTRQVLPEDHLRLFPDHFR